MSDSRSPSFFTIAATLAATGILAYAVYFDYKRRNDAGFRKQLKKEKKRIQKKASKDAISLSDEVLRQSLNDLKNEEVPESPEGKEQYFMQQVGLGEQLSIQGDEYILPASLAFFRALRVYPSPVELIVIYQKTVPEKIFNVIMRLTNLDVSFASLFADLGNPVEEVKEEANPTRRGPSSETSETTSSQEWDKLTDPGSQ